MIENKVNKKYNPWVIAGLGLASVISSLYSIWSGYAPYFQAGAGDAVVAVFQILLYDALMPIAISYIWAVVLHAIITRTVGKLVITRFDFCFYYMFFTACARVAMGIIGAFLFLAPAMSVFYTYLSTLLFGTASMALMFFLVLNKAYFINGERAKAFYGLAVPYLVWQLLAYVANVVLWAAADRLEPTMQQLGYTLIDEPNEMYAVIAGGVVLAIYIGLSVWAYLALRKKDKESPPPSNDSGKIIPPDDGDDGKVFEEFDI